MNKLNIYIVLLIIINCESRFLLPNNLVFLFPSYRIQNSFCIIPDLIMNDYSGFPLICHKWH